MKMMKNLVKVVLSGALVAGLVMMASSKAEASLQVILQEDGGAWSQALGGGGSPYPSFSNPTFSAGVFGDFSLTSGTVIADNGSLSDLLTSALRITNNSSGIHTLRILVTETDYTLPPGTPLAVEAGFAGTLNAGSVGLVGIFQAYADNSNTLPGLVNPLTTPPLSTAFTTGAQTAGQNGSTLDTGSATGAFSRTGANTPYAISSLTTLVMAGNSQLNFTSHVNVTSTVPEPISLSLLGTGLFAAASRRLWKRKQA
jgi:hypothetical protein